MYRFANLQKFLTEIHSEPDYNDFSRLSEALLGADIVRTVVWVPRRGPDIQPPFIWLLSGDRRSSTGGASTWTGPWSATVRAQRDIAPSTGWCWGTKVVLDGQDEFFRSSRYEWWLKWFSYNDKVNVSRLSCTSGCVFVALMRHCMSTTFSVSHSSQVKFIKHTCSWKMNWCIQEKYTKMLGLKVFINIVTSNSYTKIKCIDNKIYTNRNWQMFGVSRNWATMRDQYTGWPKKTAHYILLSIPLLNIDRFS